MQEINSTQLGILIAGLMICGFGCSFCCVFGSNSNQSRSKGKKYDIIDESSSSAINDDINDV